jgi:16S rRNA processing protein RimM
MNSSSKILMGFIMGACGIRGGMRFKSYGESTKDLKSYKVFQDQTGCQQLKIVQILPYKENIITLYLEGITTRSQAEAFRGMSLYIDHTQLKKLSKDEFYYHDLEGLIVQNEENCVVGQVKTVVSFGADSMLGVCLLEDPSSEILIPFRKEFVKEVNQQEKYIILDTDYVQAFLDLKGQS